MPHDPHESTRAAILECKIVFRNLYVWLNYYCLLFVSMHSPIDKKLKLHFNETVQSLSSISVRRTTVGSRQLNSQNDTSVTEL